jgi:putative tryptophan/tyrosine transport system substrate-binding protein
VNRRGFFAVLIGSAAYSFVALGQQRVKPYRIAYLALLSDENATFMKMLVSRLQELGYRDEDLELEYRCAEAHPERLPGLAAELVALRPDVLVAGFGTLPAKAAKTATEIIPIVFTTVGDPVGAGLVSSLGRPGGM